MRMRVQDKRVELGQVHPTGRGGENRLATTRREDLIARLANAGGFLISDGLAIVKGTAVIDDDGDVTITLDCSAGFARPPALTVINGSSRKFMVTCTLATPDDDTE